MSAKFIPVETLTDYQRWQFAGIGIDETPEPVVEELLQEEPEPVLEPAEPEGPKVEGPTAEDIGRIYHDAHREGYEAGLVEGLETGHAEGFEAGHAEGYEAGQKKGHEEAVDAAKPLATLFDSFSSSVEEVRQEIAKDIVSLALEVARQVLKTALKVEPALLIPIVKGAMESMPQGSQHPHIHLHPEDAVLVKELLKEDLSHGGWRVVEDHRVERGGCRIETASAELDATLPGRWMRVTQALQQDSSWFENAK